jgi:uncharacterized protein (TIGR02996 family)
MKKEVKTSTRQEFPKMASGAVPVLAEDPKNAAALRAVLASPDDDTPRLAYANLLGDANPRSLFIRAQLTIARHNSDRNNPECFQAFQKSSRLRERHYAVWRPNWSDEVAKRVLDYKFYKGFVELVKISGADLLEFGAEVLSAAPIRHLDLVLTKGLWPKLSAYDGFRSIRSLSLDDNALSDKDLSCIAESSVMGNLRWLTLINNDIGEEGILALASHHSSTLRRLEYVSLEGNPCNPIENLAADGDLITGEWLPEIGKHLESRFGPIRWLHRGAQKLSDIPPNRFRLTDADNLVKLSFNSKLSDSPSEALTEVR